MEYRLYTPTNGIWVPTDSDPLNLEDSSKHRALIIGQVQSGKTKFMIEQTERALESNFDTVIIIGGTNNNLLSQTQNRFFKKFEEFIFFDIKGTSRTAIPNGKSIITTLKGKDSLIKIKEIIKNSYDKKILIFDDESDFGSINTSSSEEPTTINKLLNEIYEEIHSGLLVSVTATPFADLISDNSKNIKYAYIIKANEEYTGISFFENNDDIYKTLEIEKSSKILPKKLSYSIITDHIKRVVQSGEKSSQILLNSSLGKIYHDRDFTNFSQIINELLSIPLNNIFEDDQRDKAYKILKEISENIIIMNQDGNYNYDEEKHSLVIGGSLVSRGFTFSKLFTTVIINEPLGKQSADTLLQRARWFGYRRKIYKYMKVYTTDTIRSSLTECEELVNYLNKLLEENSIEDISKKLKNIKFDFIEITGKKIKNGK